MHQWGGFGEILSKIFAGNNSGLLYVWFSKTILAIVVIEQHYDTHFRENQLKWHLLLFRQPR
jgi:hypothetical protein